MMKTDCNCGTQFCKHHKAQVWSNGGGTQSWAIAAAICKGMIEKPDISATADTGYETNATWEGMERIIGPELSKVGVVVERIMASEWGRKGVGNSLWVKVKNASEKNHALCAYSTMTGIPVKLTNRCSHMWKAEPIRRWLSSKGITRSKCVIWIGFSRDEQRRIVNMERCDDFKKGLIRFPLLELGLTRQDCIKLVESMGWGTPPRSACYMCPNHSDHEWRKLKTERPDEFQKAVELEREIHKVDPDAWLHRSCIPLDQVDFSQPEDLFSRPCDSGMCFV